MSARKQGKRAEFAAWARRLRHTGLRVFNGWAVVRGGKRGFGYRSGLILTESPRYAAQGQLLSKIVFSDEVVCDKDTEVEISQTFGREMVATDVRVTGKDGNVLFSASRCSVYIEPMPGAIDVKIEGTT